MPTALKVTAGSLCQIETGLRSFNLSAGPLALSIHLSDSGSFLIPAKQFPGDAYACGGQLVGDQTLNNGHVDFNGTSYTRLWFTGSLTFDSKPFTMPADGPNPLTRTAAFTMSGNLQAFPNNPFVGPPGPEVFDVTFTGNGVATVRFGATLGWPAMPDGRLVQSLFHQFEK